MPNSQLTVPNLKKRIESRLGGRGVKVELEANDYEECVRSALEFYNQRRPFKRRYRLQNASMTTKRYVLDLSLHPGFAGVVHCEFITRTTTPAQVDAFDPFSTTIGGASLGSSGGNTFADLMQSLTYTEDASRIADAEPEWEGLWEGDVYALYVSIPRSNVAVGYEWSGYYSFDNTPTGTGMTFIPNGDVEWFIRYSTAWAKEFLGRVRGKYQGITNPDGSQDPVDNAELLSESQQEKEALELELNKRRVPLGPITE